MENRASSFLPTTPGTITLGWFWQHESTECWQMPLPYLTNNGLLFKQ